MPQQSSDQQNEQRENDKKLVRELQSKVEALVEEGKRTSQEPNGPRVYGKSLNHEVNKDPKPSRGRSDSYISLNVEPLRWRFE